jgi:sugar/nucleoside kinase (ribokinase family)
VLAAGALGDDLLGDIVVASPDSAAPERLPALEVEVADTTGCGDGFTAGLQPAVAGRIKEHMS